MQRPQHYTAGTSAYTHRAHFADQQAKADPRKRAQVNEAQSLQRLQQKRAGN